MFLTQHSVRQKIMMSNESKINSFVTNLPLIIYRIRFTFLRMCVRVLNISFSGAEEIMFMFLFGLIRNADEAGIEKGMK